MAWQLFVPPIIGLADQGDFVRLLGPLGYAPVPKGPEHKYWYVTRTYVKDPSYREPRWELATSEFIPAGIAIALNTLFENPYTFDITVFGFTHMVLFLIALARLLYVTGDLAMYRLVWALILLVLTDVGYVAYWNSLYTEPASCLWFLFFLAESINLCKSREISIGPVLRWSAFAVLWIAAKSQNAALSVPLAAYGLGMLRRTCDRKTWCAAVGGVVAICLAGVIMYRSLPPATRVTAVYNAIFFGILPESDDPQSDLKALGLNPGYAQYSGTVAWSPGTGVADGVLVNALLNDVSSFRLTTFYLKRPRRMWRHVRRALSNRSFSAAGVLRKLRQVRRPASWSQERRDRFVEPLPRARLIENRSSSSPCAGSGGCWRIPGASSQRRFNGGCPALDGISNLPRGVLFDGVLRRRIW